jgi:4-hydroxybenzoate polyprenyltransferase
MITVKNYLSLIKFSHTIFAMPFALIGFFLGLSTFFYTSSESIQSNNWSQTLWLLFPVILCMVFARSAAMAFNRYLDRDIDALNPRTAIREVPKGIIKAKNALIFTILIAFFSFLPLISSILFVFIYHL